MKISGQFRREKQKQPMQRDLRIVAAGHVGGHLHKELFTKLGKGASAG